eukprot:scaffold4743_cov171-Amphora_coffeaeformis.AAC.5
MTKKAATAHTAENANIPEVQKFGFGISWAGTTPLPNEPRADMRHTWRSKEDETSFHQSFTSIVSHQQVLGRTNLTTS